MKKIVLLAALAALPVVAQAQLSVFSFNQDGGGFYVSAGTYGSNVDEQYKKLGLSSVRGNDSQNIDSLRRNPHSYPIPASSLLAFGIGGYGIRSSIIFGGELNFYLGGTTSASLTDATLSPQFADYRYTLKSNALGGDVLATVGVVALRAGGLVVKPVIGVGYGAMAIRISDSRANRQYPIYTSGNQENKYLWNGGLTLDFGLGADFHFSGLSERAKGFKIGAKIGYRVQSAGDWADRGDKLRTKAYDGSTLTPLGKLGSDGIYLKISIGVGSCGKAKE